METPRTGLGIRECVPPNVLLQKYAAQTLHLIFSNDLLHGFAISALNYVAFHFENEISLIFVLLLLENRRFSCADF